LNWNVYQFIGYFDDAVSTYEFNQRRTRLENYYIHQTWMDIIDHGSFNNGL